MMRVVAVMVMAVLAHGAQAAEQTGIAACDQYLVSYDTCISSKIPKDQQAQHRANLQQTRAMWKQGAGDAEARKELSEACQEMTAAMKPVLASMGCSI